jgi:enediyne biosynthesis protein E3
VGRLAYAALRLPDAEVSMARRGFRGAGLPACDRLETVGRSFVAGYAAALQEDRPDLLATRLGLLPRELAGFAHEGAGLALALRDTFAPWRRPGRLAEFIAGPGAPHRYLLHVGAGWLLARLPLSVGRLLRRLDPVIGWLAVDGYGFHRGFFHGRVTLDGQRVPRKVTGYARRAFDQGLGRSVWFVEGAAVERVAEVIAAFPQERHDDLWSGVGVAAAFAGGVDRSELQRLRAACGPHLPAVAQGASLVAFSRREADNPAAHTDLACRVLCGRGADEVAAVVEEAGRNLSPDGELPAFEVWRRRIQERLFAAAEEAGEEPPAPRAAAAR